jgi:CubicO group peptidase (beta-lactamase class C family)
MSLTSKLGRPLAAIVAITLLSQHAAGQTCPGATWQRTAPAAAGWSTSKLKHADAVARKLGTSSYLVVQAGKVVWRYGDAGQPSNVHSVRKSLASLLFGIAHDEGRVPLARTLGKLGIDDKGEALSEIEKSATIKDLLSARSCIYHEAAYETKSIQAKRPQRHSCKPGERWYYNNWDFNALGTIYSKATTRSLFDGLDERLARPLQFENFDKVRDTKFHSESVSAHPAYLIRLSASDLARVGVLVARGGDWCGHRIVSKRWIERSTSRISETDRATGYGYLWWVGENGRQFHVQFPGRTISARGNHGQFMIINPALDLVIVHRVNTDVPGAEVRSGAFGRLLSAIMAAKRA